MKKGKLMLLGSAVFACSLFTNAAFAAEHEKETNASSFFTTFTQTKFIVDHSKDAPLPQHAWTLAPMEGQTAPAAPATVDQTTSANAGGWVFAPPSTKDSNKE